MLARVQDQWFGSCVDLINTRFNAGECKSLGIEGVTVTGVTRYEAVTDVEILSMEIFCLIFL